jgi:hypothetical protein
MRHRDMLLKSLKSEEHFIALFYGAAELLWEHTLLWSTSAAAHAGYCVTIRSDLQRGILRSSHGGKTVLATV